MRVLLIDWTKFGNGSATGEIKTSYFAGFEPGSVLHMYADGMANVGLAEDGDPKKAKVFAPHDRALDQACAAYAPDVVLYRPVADRPAFHDAAMRLVRGAERPLALWMMDDWPERLRVSDPNLYPAMAEDLQELFARSKANFSICEKMTAEYEARYGTSFSVFRNGVRLADWPVRPSRSKPEGEPVVLRYAGSLAPDMTRDAVRDVAQAVEDLSARLPVRMEIHTRPHWFEGEKASYEKLAAVKVHTKLLSEKDYRAWLMGADISLIGYNFDDETVRYSSLSFANKTPECLASGAAVLAYGPRQIATIDFLARRGGAALVEARSPDLLRETLERLVSDAAARETLAKEARAIASAEFDLDKQRARFAAALRKISPRAKPLTAAPKKPVEAQKQPTPAAAVPKPAAKPAVEKPTAPAAAVAPAARPVETTPATKPAPAPAAPPQAATRAAAPSSRAVLAALVAVAVLAIVGGTVVASSFEGLQLALALIGALAALGTAAALASAILYAQLSRRLGDVGRELDAARLALGDAERRLTAGASDDRRVSAVLKTDLSTLSERVTKEARLRVDLERSLALTLRMRSGRLDALAKSAAGLSAELDAARLSNDHALDEIRSRLEAATAVTAEPAPAAPIEEPSPAIAAAPTPRSRRPAGRRPSGRGAPPS